MPPFSLAENQHRSRLADDEKKKPPTPAPASPSETPRKRPSKNSKLTSCGELSQIPHMKSIAAPAASRICRSAANWHSRSPAFRSASAFAASSAADSARTARTSASSARMRPSPDPATEAQVGVSGAFKPKNDNTSSPPTAFVFGNGFISPTWALFLNIPLESCEKSVFPMISVFKNRLPHRGLLRREEESRTGQH